MYLLRGRVMPKTGFTVIFLLLSYLETLHGLLNLPKAEVNIKPTLKLHRDTVKTLEDFTRKNDYLDFYREMLKISQDSNDVNGGEDSSRNLGEEDAAFKDGYVIRRHGSLRRSMLGRRRARSQALRREKLNSQSLRSHLQHTRHTSTLAQQ